MLEGTASTGVGYAGTAGRGRRRPAPEITRRNAVAGLAAMSLLDMGRPLSPDPEAEAEATAAAEAWLDLVDQGQLALSWAAAAPPLRQAIGEGEWKVALRTVRTPLGPCRSRTLRRRTTLEAFPGVPPGPYTVIRFETGFEEHPAAIETVTVRLEDDGHWRVAAYFIR